MGGVQSQPMGRKVSRMALAGVQSQPSGRRVSRFSLGTSLGADDDVGQASDLTVPTIDDGTRQFQRDILASTRAIQAHERERIRKEEIRGWVQIAATLSIPLAAAIWRAIGIGRRKRAEAASSAP